ncbi:hypothetical protein [Streptomyces sp. NPDC014894]|uniref:hypothetical protein n=1 Tax=Streptomyces sp. NPDC014894 TaxID=3364931 RepID=UPI0036F9979B
MAAVVELLKSVRNIVPLTGEGVSAHFAAQGWMPEGRPKNGFETSWDKDGIGGWVHPHDGGVRVEFTVWMRNADDDGTGYFEDAEAVYEEGEQALSAFLPEILSSSLADGLVEAEGTADDTDEFIAFRKWGLDGRTLIVAVIQEDTDLPVRLITALEDRPPGEG